MMLNRHWVWQGGLLMILLVNRITHGDLYTHGVLSLEWLVDSSDEIHLVRYRPSESEPGGGLVAGPLRTLKPESGQTALTEERLRDRLQPTGTGKPGSGEWILFIRLMDDGQPRIVQGIDLERPMASFRSAAITRDCTPIKERHAILSAVHTRIRLGRRLPARCDRFAVDGPIRPNRGFSYLNETSPHGDPAPLEKFLGDKHPLTSFVTDQEW